MGTQMARIKVDMRVLRELTANVPERALAVVQKIAQDVETDIKQNFSPSSPSSPGTPPAVVTGKLKNSIVAVRANKTSWTVKYIGYAVYLEYGTPKMAARPFFKPAVERVIQSIPPQLLTSVVEGKRRYK